MKIKKEKTEYFRKLRQKWSNTKKLLDEKKIDEISAIVKTHGLNVSAISFLFVSLQMKSIGYDGIPYLDMKTYLGWKENGFQVSKGEKSHISGITWISPRSSDDSDDESDTDNDFVFPKEYKLFHRSQVQPI